MSTTKDVQEDAAATINGLVENLAERQKELRTHALQFIEREETISRLTQALRDFLDFAPRASQLLDGWHADGTAWSTWDESVRKELSELHTRIDKMLPALQPGSNATALGSERK
jgi:hypothetical protein